jgi:hypothetical protein
MLTLPMAKHLAIQQLLPKLRAPQTPRTPHRLEFLTLLPTASPLHRIKEPLPITILPEDRLPAVPPIPDVVGRSRILNPQLARHPQQRPRHTIDCN